MSLMLQHKPLQHMADVTTWHEKGRDNYTFSYNFSLQRCPSYFEKATRKRQVKGDTGSLATPITHTPETPDEWSSVGSGVCPSTKLCMYLTGTRGGPKLLA